MRALLQRRRVGATRRSSGGEGGGGWRWRRLALEKSLDWIRLQLLVVLVLVLLVMVMVMVKMVMVMIQRYTVVTQPIFGGLGHGLKDPTDASLSLHELCDGRAVLLLLLLLLVLLVTLWSVNTVQEIR